ncbi:MAG: Hsp20/alpha crystallin family protein [Chloroflexi bacterium]|nr:MAG: heat-shock protein Hsp20 [Phototrophicales bacterium]RMF82821.1 MAG: Hsp20/alpha crystallin family protein [Chloroflexota bacterium]
MSLLIRRNQPFRELTTWQDAIDRFFDEDWFNMRSLYQRDGEVIRPLALDVTEDDTAYTVVANIPGVDAENININYQDDVLTIEGEVPEQVVEKESARAIIKERRYGKFSRSLRLPNVVNVDAIEANFENGVLTITLPKAEEAQPKRIAVKSNS